MSAPRKIGLFGGTFDPVHLGHIHLAAVTRDALDLDEVRFIPCPISPHKAGTPPASGADRCEMLRIATADLQWAVVDDCELRRSAPAYSYLTVETMAAQFPAARLVWMLGGDQWDALPRWQNPGRLAELVEFAVLSRGNLTESREGYRLHVIQGDHPASATEIRSAISNGTENHEWLDPTVAEWIREKSLYCPP